MVKNQIGILWEMLTCEKLISFPNVTKHCITNAFQNFSQNLGIKYVGIRAKHFDFIVSAS